MLGFQTAFFEQAGVCKIAAKHKSRHQLRKSAALPLAGVIQNIDFITLISF